jgi:hypothetical protein
VLMGVDLALCGTGARESNGLVGADRSGPFAALRRLLPLLLPSVDYYRSCQAPG